MNSKPVIPTYNQETFSPKNVPGCDLLQM